MASVLFTNLDFPEELYASSSTTTTSSSSSAATERTVSLNPLVSALLDLAPSVYLPLEDQRKDEEGNSKSSGKIHNSSSSWSSSSTAAAFIRDFVFWKQVSQVTENVRVQQQEKVAGQQMRQKPAAATTTALPADRRSSSPTAHIDQDIDAVIVSAHRQVSSSSSPTISLDSKVQQAKSANDKDPQKSDLKQQSPEKDKDIEPLSAATVAIVTVGSALGLFSTFKASQSYANHVFLDEFHIHLIHLHRVLAATEHWCKER